MTEAPQIEGQPVEDVQMDDFFAFQATERWVIPGSNPEQWFDIKVLNEGDRAKFQKSTSRDMKLGNRGEATIKMDASVDRHALLKTAVTGWYLVRGGREYAYSERSMDDVLKYFPVRIIEGLERAVRQANPWLLGDIKAEDIREEIKNLEEQLVLAEERERGGDN